MAGLRLTTAAGIEKGADTVVIIARGDPEHSPLIRAIGYAEKIKMPPTGKLPDTEIQALREWVRMGAPWPAGDASATASKVGSDLWSFKPVRDSAPPPVRDAAWVQNP